MVLDGAGVVAHLEHWHCDWRGVNIGHTGEYNILLEGIVKITNKSTSAPPGDHTRVV